VALSYRVSKWKAALWVGFALLWFGLVVRNAFINMIPDEDATGWRVFIAIGALVFGLFPALVLARRPYEVRLEVNGDVEVRSVLGLRRIRPQQVTSIAWDEEGDMRLSYDGGRFRMPANDECKDIAFQLAALNPAIKIDGEFTTWS
jgi:hypothetical protein